MTTAPPTDALLAHLGELAAEIETAAAALDHLYELRRLAFVELRDRGVGLPQIAEAAKVSKMIVVRATRQA